MEYVWSTYTVIEAVLLLVILTLLACWWWWWWWRDGPLTLALPLPPGSLGLPWVGESVAFLAALRAGDHDRFLRDRTARWGSPTFKTRIFNHNTVVLQGAAANRFIAGNENKGLLRNAWPLSMLAIVGKGAPVALHGAEHRRLRHTLLSCLSPLALHSLVAPTHTITLHHFATSWQQQLMSLAPLLKLHTFRLACSLLANITDEHLLSRLYPHFNAWLAGMLNLPLDLPGTKYRQARLAGDVLRREMGGIIDRKLEQQLKFSGDHLKELDVLSMLLKADQDQCGGFLSRHEMQDVLLFLLFAGHDTTTAALTFALKFLEQNPACLDQVIQEQEKIACGKKPGERLNWGDVQSMKYTWRVIQETMRLRPPVIASLKEATEDLVFERYHIPMGWKVYFGIARTHTNDKYFPNASKFDPSRFDADVVEGGPPPFAYVPFGVGPHSCPGNEFARMTMCVYLHVLVQHFKWASLHPHEGVSVSTFPTLVEGYPASIIQKKPIIL